MLTTGGTLTHFTPMFRFYTPSKRQKTKGFVAFSGVIEKQDRCEMG